LLHVGNLIGSHITQAKRATVFIGYIGRWHGACKKDRKVKHQVVAMCRKKTKKKKMVMKFFGIDGAKGDTLLLGTHLKGVVSVDGIVKHAF